MTVGADDGRTDETVSGKSESHLRTVGKGLQSNSKTDGGEYTDHYINGVTYRVWSAFEGKTNAADSLSGLMLRKLESGEQVGEVVDEFKEGIKRVSNCSLVTM